MQHAATRLRLAALRALPHRWRADREGRAQRSDHDAGPMSHSSLAKIHGRWTYTCGTGPAQGACPVDHHSTCAVRRWAPCSARIHGRDRTPPCKPVAYHVLDLDRSHPAMSRFACVVAGALLLCAVAAAQAVESDDLQAAYDAYYAAQNATGRPHLDYSVLVTARPLLDSMAQLGRSVPRERCR